MYLRAAASRMTHHSQGRKTKMTEDPRSLKERLSVAAEAIGHQKHLDQPGKTLVIMSGLNDTSKEALLNRVLIIQHFPFIIGRFLSQEPFSSMTQDLVNRQDLHR